MSWSRFDRIMKQIVFAGALLFCLTAPLSVWGSVNVKEQAAAQVLTADIECGYGGLTGSDRYVPVRITIKAEEAFRGTVSIYLMDELSENYIYQKDLELRKGQERRVSFTVPVLKGEGTRVVIQEDGGEIVYEKALEPTGLDSNLFYVGILSDEENSLKYLDAYPMYSGSSMQCETYHLSMSELPYKAKDLDLFDMIIINNMDTEKISLNRRETLLEWARNGGWLIFGAGDQAVKTLSGFSKDLGIKVEEVMTSEDDYSLAKVSMDQSDQISVDENGCAIYQRRRLGNGWVGIVAYDMEAVAESSRWEEEATSLMFSRLISKSALDDSLSGRSAGSQIYYQLAGVPETGQMPSVFLYGGILTSYVLIVLPGLYLLLKKKDRLFYFRSGVAASAVIFAILIYAASSNTRFSSLFCNYVMYREIDEEVQRDQILTSIQSPGNWRYEAEIAGTVELKPILDISMGNSSRSSSRTVIGGEAGKNVISFQKMVAFYPRYFELEQKRRETDQRIDSEITSGPGGLTGTLTNHLGINLEQAAIFWYGNVVPLGYVAKDQTIDLSSYKCYSYQEESIWEAAVKVANGKLTGSYRVGDSRTAAQRADILSSYLGRRFSNYSEDVCIVGFASRVPEGPESIINYESHGTTLVAASLDVSKKGEGGIYQSVLQDEPVPVVGGYYGDGTPYAESTVLDYQIRPHMKLRRLMLRDCSLGGKSPQGEMYFYNWQTREFDLAASGQTSWSAEELMPYLLDSSLRVKWTSGENTGKIPSFSMLWEE